MAVVFIIEGHIRPSVLAHLPVQTVIPLDVMAGCGYYVSIFLLATLHITYFLSATSHMQVLFVCMLGANVAGLKR